MNLLYRFNGETVEYPENRTIEQLIDKSIQDSPDRVALVGKDELCITYGELGRITDEIALRLRECGAGPDKIIALLCKRSPEMALVMLATLKAGAAFLPIGVDNPEERIRFYLEDSKRNYTD